MDAAAGLPRCILGILWAGYTFIRLSKRSDLSSHNATLLLEVLAVKKSLPQNDHNLNTDQH